MRSESCQNLQDLAEYADQTYEDLKKKYLQIEEKQKGSQSFTEKLQKVISSVSILEHSKAVTIFLLYSVAVCDQKY